MANVNDPGKYREKFEKAKARLESADIDENDRKSIQTLIQGRESSDSYEYSTLEQYATVLKRAAELTEKPLHTWEETPYESDYNTFMDGLKDGSLPSAKEGGYSAEYRRSFRQVLRVYFQHMGKDFADDIEIGQPSAGNITEDDCFTADETSRMFQVADVRDSALIALWLATGQRASAMASLRLGDIEIGEQVGRFYLNPEAVGLKGAEGYRTMLWATPYVARWVNQHPRRGEDDAGLFCSKRNGHGYSIGDALSYEGIRRAVESVAKRAEIPDEKINTHRFRHTAIRRMIRDGLSDQKIKSMVGWHEDSSQLARYGSMKDETHAGDIEEHYGLTDEKTEEKYGLRHDNCPRCQTALSELVQPHFCPSCGLPLRHTSEQVETALNDKMFGGMGEAESDDVKDGVEVAREILESDPEAKAALLDELKADLLDEIED